MSKRSNISYSNSSSTVQPSARPQRKVRHSYYTVPKTRSESFVEYLQSTGYALPRNFQSTHCDYLFEDPELFDCVKFLMGNAKRMVSDTELERYKEIESSGDLVDRENLPSAVAAVEAKQMEFSNKQEALKKEMDSLTAEINDRQTSINHWKQVLKSTEFVNNLRRGSLAQEDYQETLRSQKLESLNTEITVKKILLKEEVKSTSKYIKEALENHSENDKQHFLCQYDWTPNSTEEELMSMLRKIAESYGTGLVGKSEDVDPVAMEELIQECSGNVKEVQRLQYCILAAYLEDVKITAELEVKSGLEAAWQDVIEQAQRIATLSPEIQSKILDDIVDLTASRKGKVNVMKETKLMEFVNSEAAKLNNQIQNVQNVKIMAKMKETQFFGMVCQMLLNQRARYEIAMTLIRQEAFTISSTMESMRVLQSHLRRIATFQELNDPVAEEKILCNLYPSLSKAFRKKRIPIMNLCSYGLTWKSLSLLKEGEQLEECRKNMIQGRQASRELKEIQEIAAICKANWIKLKTTHFSLNNSSQEAKDLNQLLAEYTSLKSNVASVPEVQEKRIREAIEWKRSKQQEVKNILEKIQCSTNASPIKLTT